jgi:hypothetical protein
MQPSSGSHSSATFPSSHPKLSKTQAFGLGAGVGVGAKVSASSFSYGGGKIGTLGASSPFAGRQYGGAARVSLAGGDALGHHTDHHPGLDLRDVEVLERLPIRLLRELHGLVAVPVRLLAGADPRPLLLRVRMRESSSSHLIHARQLT